MWNGRIVVGEGGLFAAFTEELSVGSALPSVGSAGLTLSKARLTLTWRVEDSRHQAARRGFFVADLVSKRFGVANGNGENGALHSQTVFVHVTHFLDFHEKSDFLFRFQ